MSENQVLFIGRTGEAHSLTTNERALSDEIDARDRIIERLQAALDGLLRCVSSVPSTMKLMLICGEFDQGAIDLGKEVIAEIEAAIAAAKVAGS